MSLSIKALKEENSIQNELIEVATIEYQGKEHVIQFQPIFPYNKIRKCVLEIGQFFESAIKEKVNVDPLDEDSLIDYFIIRQFSKGLKFTTSKKAKTIYDEFMTLYNSSLYQIFKKEIFTSNLVEKSKEQVYDELFANIELSAKFENKLKKAQEMIMNLPLENKDVIFGTEKGKQIPEV